MVSKVYNIKQDSANLRFDAAEAKVTYCTRVHQFVSVFVLLCLGSTVHILQDSLCYWQSFWLVFPTNLENPYLHVVRGQGRHVVRALHLQRRSQGYHTLCTSAAHGCEVFALALSDSVVSVCASAQQDIDSPDIETLQPFLVVHNVILSQRG